MAKRIMTRIGDVFCVEIDGKYKYYFQYIANDMTMLNSSVIRAFKTRYSIDSNPSVDHIISDDVTFYAHTVLRLGIQDGIWYKIGKSNEIDSENLNKTIFSYTIDQIYEPPHILSVDPLKNWYIWHVNEPSINVGELPQEYYNLVEFGIVLSYANIVDKLKYGYNKHTNIVYDVIKRVPLPYVDSYVRQEVDDRVTYYHFKGKHAIRQLVITDGKAVKLTEACPEADGMMLRKAYFGDTNWRHREFIDADEFEKAWLSAGS